MADYDQLVGSIVKTQRWKETSTGIHARMVAGALVGMSTDEEDILIKCTTGGSFHIELQGSTEIIGLLGASTASIGILGASTEKIGALQPSTEVIGHIIPDASTAIIGYVQPMGSTWATLLASAARSSDTLSAAQTNDGYQAHILHVVHDTATGAALTPTLQIKESISSGYKSIWTASAVISSTGHYAYLFALGGVGSAGSYDEACNLRLGPTWRLSVAHSSSGATTYNASVDNLV